MLDLTVTNHRVDTEEPGTAANLVDFQAGLRTRILLCSN